MSVKSFEQINTTKVEKIPWFVDIESAFKSRDILSNKHISSVEQNNNFELAYLQNKHKCSLEFSCRDYSFTKQACNILDQYLTQQIA